MQDIVAYLEAEDELYVRDARAGADEKHGLDVRVVTQQRVALACSRTTCSSVSAADELAGFQPDFTVLHAPELEAESREARDPHRRPPWS